MIETAKQLVFWSQHLGGCFLTNFDTKKHTTHQVNAFACFQCLSDNIHSTIYLYSGKWQWDSVQIESSYWSLCFFYDWSDSVVFHNLFEGRSIGSAIRRPKGLVGNNWWKRRGDVVAATNLPTCQSTWQREQLGTKTWGATCSCFHRYQMEPVRLSKPIYRYIKD